MSSNRSSCGDIAIFRIFKWPSPLSWIFWNSKILLAIGAERVETHQHAKFRQNRSTGCEDIKIFRFFKITASASGRMAQTHHFTKFRRNWSFHCGDVSIFHIFKMVTAAILDIWNHEILLAIRMARVETHHHAKFCQNWSIGRKDIMIFRFFKMAGAAILDCRIHKILLAVGVWGPICIIVPNLVKIGRSIAEILQFFEFSNWPPPPSWILFVIGVQRVEAHQYAKFRQNRSIGCEDIKIFFRFFKMAAGRPSSWICLGHI